MTTFSPGSLVRCRERERVVLRSETPDLLLCDRWQRELTEKFAIDAVVVRAGTLAYLECGLPLGNVSVFEHESSLVVSIDFVTFARRRDSFVRGCFDLVIVDEAHAAAPVAGPRMAANITRCRTSRRATPAEIDQTLSQVLDWMPRSDPELSTIANARGLALLEAHRRQARPLLPAA
jgi:hypothetical protein